MEPRHILSILLVMILSITISATGQDQAESESEAEVRIPLETIELTLADNIFTVELAYTRVSRKQGLMYREHIPDNMGMLFIHTESKVCGYWMKNCAVDLDILFIREDGTITTVHTMTVLPDPKIPDNEIPIYSSRMAVKYALELAAGTAKELGLFPGEKIVIPAAIKELDIQSDSYVLASNPWLSVAPPLVAIGIAIIFRQVYVALLIGLWSGCTVLTDGNVIKGLVDTIELCVGIFQSENNTKVILFSACIGAVIAFTQKSGGVQGLINFVSSRGLITTRRRAHCLTVLLGASIPIESSINVLVTGTVSRPIFDKLKISREKLAYLCDSISAPVCTLIPINAWGAYASGLLDKQGIEKPVVVYFQAITMNFYAMLAILLVIILIITQKDFFTMARAERRAREEGKVLRDGATPLISTDVISIDPKKGVAPRAINMVVPVATMVGMMVAGMLITGKGHITEGDGSTSVLWAVLAAVLVGGAMYRVQGIMKFKELMNLFFQGVGGLIPIAILMMFAFAIGQLCRDLETGKYVASVVHDSINSKFLPVLLFVITGFIAFATGTSWGTWGIMFPIGIGVAQGLSLEILPMVAAMMSGGVFGDHCSPISDTTLVSSMASASDHMDHVNTQLPYALTAGAAAALMFLLLGFIKY